MRLPVLSDIDTSKLHHAYGIAGNASVVAVLKDWIRTTDLNTTVTELSFQTLGIDDAHTLKDLTRYKNGDQLQTVIITANTITREAQNALLKLFEEPVSGIHFFLIIPSFDILLPTLASRLQKIEVTVSDEATTFDAKKFITDDSSDRIALIESLLKKTEDSDESKSAITRTVLDCIEHLIVNQAEYKKPKTIKAIQFVRKYQNLQGASHKMLLEYLALNI